MADYDIIAAAPDVIGCTLKDRTGTPVPISSGNGDAATLYLRSLLPAGTAGSGRVVSFPMTISGATGHVSYQPTRDDLLAKLGANTDWQLWVGVVPAPSGTTGQFPSQGYMTLHVEG